MKTNLLWVDNAKVSATLAVVVLHVSAATFASTGYVGSYSWQVANFFDAISRWSVPVFVMVSGGLLLDPQKAHESLHQFFAKRASRILIPLLFWSLFFLLFAAAKQYNADGNIPAKLLLRSLVAGQPYYHLWYLYMLVGLYLFTPFVRVLVRNLDERQTLFLASAILALAILSSAYSSLFYAQGLQTFLIWFLPYLSYFLFGYLIVANGRTIVNTYALVIIFATSVTLTAIGYYLAFTYIGSFAAPYFYSYFSLTVVPMSLSAFLLLKRLPPLPKLAKIAPFTLGIYLIHPLYLQAFDYLGYSATIQNPLWAIPGITLVVGILSLGSTWILSKIPLLRRVI